MGGKNKFIQMKKEIKIGDNTLDALKIIRNRQKWLRENHIQDWNQEEIKPKQFHELTAMDLHEMKWGAFWRLDYAVIFTNVEKQTGMKAGEFIVRLNAFAESSALANCG